MLGKFKISQVFKNLQGYNIAKSNIISFFVFDKNFLFTFTYINKIFIKNDFLIL